MTDISSRIHETLTDGEFLQKLANGDADEAEPEIRATLKWIDGSLELQSLGEKARAIVREIELDWIDRSSGETGRETLVLPESRI